MTSPGHLGAIVAAIQAAAPELSTRVYAGFAPHGTARPYCVVSEVGGSVQYGSSRRGRDELVIQISIYAETSAQTGDISASIRGGVFASSLALAAGWSVVAWFATSPGVLLVERPDAPSGSVLFHRALSYRLIMSSEDLIR